jgi:biopolymer transport protein ExbB
MNLVERITHLANYGASWVLWLLVALSILAVSIMIERAVLLASARDNVIRLRREIRALLERGDLRAARRRLEQSPSIEARVALAGLDAPTAGSAEERIRGETQLARVAMERHLGLLGTLGSNAPFVGLLGTVIGIVRAFRELSASKGQVSAALLAEIGEALVATAIGLLVALPAIAAFNAFQRTIRERLARADALGHEILAYFKAGTTPAPEAAE